MKKGETSIVVLNDSLCQNLGTKKIMANEIKNKLEDIGYKDVTTIDCGSLILNKQHNITEFLKNNLSVAEIKATQKEGITAARKGIISKIFIPRSYEDMYQISSLDRDIKISDTIKNSKNSAVVLSCVANDLMASVWVNPISYKLGSFGLNNDVKKRTKVFLGYDKLKKEVIDGLKNNVEQVLGINNNAKICIIGIYQPYLMSENFKHLFCDINSSIESIAKKYNQSYININDINSKKFSSLPTEVGFKVISDRVAKTIIDRFAESEQYICVGEFKYNNLGIDGALSDLRIQYIKEQATVDELIDYLIVTGCSRKDVLKFMKDYIEGRPNEVRKHREIYEKAKCIVKTK